ncbi:MAG: sulfatase-like hydrolase/transferase [Myxococcota bacterium]
MVPLAVAFVACQPSRPKPANIVVVVLDTVRADHLSTYGYARETTPNLTRFVANATQYPRAFSSAPWTLPSHASLFTGRPPL